jgi:hypothetical protein
MGDIADLATLDFGKNARGLEQRPAGEKDAE